MKTARAGAKRWNKIEDAIVDRFFEKRDMLIEALMADGHPPLTEPVSEQEQYRNLVAMRDSGDPEFWNNPEAIKELERLSARYGDPRAPTIGAFGEQSNVQSPQSVYERYV